MPRWWPWPWLLCCLGYVVGEAIVYRECGGNVTQVRVDPCPEQPCPAVKGGAIHVEADFVSDRKFDRPTLWVGAKLAGVSLPLPGLERDVCRGRNVTCPVLPGAPQTFVFDLKILPFFPKLETITVFEASDPEGKLFCFEAPVKIVD